jgi:hypothetical protein
MRQLLKRVPRGRTVLSVLVALSCALLVLGIAVKGWGQDEHAPNPLNIATRDDPEPNNGFGGGADVQELEPKLPADLNVFNLTLEQTRQYSVRSHYPHRRCTGSARHEAAELHTLQSWYSLPVSSR